MADTPVKFNFTVDSSRLSHHDFSQEILKSKVMAAIADHMRETGNAGKTDFSLFVDHKGKEGAGVINE